MIFVFIEPSMFAYRWRKYLNAMRANNENLNDKVTQNKSTHLVGAVDYTD